MTDALKNLIPLLSDCTVVIEKNGERRSFTKRGITPLLELSESGADYSGAIAADRVVGKAAALLYEGLGVKAIYARVISQPALEVLEEWGIECDYGEKVPYIVNRRGDGRCPMEQAVEKINSYSEAVEAIEKTLARLNGGAMKKLGFGLMRLPLLGSDSKKIDHDQVCRMVDEFLARGFTYFDTAYMYHEFQSEKEIKEALVKRYPREKFLLADKLPSMFLKNEGDQERIFAEQLFNCGVEYFDYYLIHCLNVENYAKAQKFDSFGFALEMKKQGKIKKLGFSFHDTAEVLEKIITEHPEVEFVQLQINYLDWLDNGVQSQKCYEVARKYGKEIIIMEPIKGGTLVNIPDKAREILASANAEKTPASWALNFAADLEGVIMVLSGMSNLKQLVQNTELFDNMKPLSKEHFDMLTVDVAGIIKTPKSIACTGCSYCTDGCQKKINIPAIFAVYNRAVGDALNFANYKGKYEKAVNGSGKASDCIKCRQCERICPQKLPIVKTLGNISEILE